MMLTTFENKLNEFNTKVGELEKIGFEKCQFMHDCRTLIVIAATYQTQVKRAITLMKEGKIQEALAELGAIDCAKPESSAKPEA